MSDQEKEITFKLVDYVLRSIERKKLIKKKNLLALLEERNEKKDFNRHFNNLQEALYNVFRMTLFEISLKHLAKEEKRYLLGNKLEKKYRRQVITPLISTSETWMVLPILSVLILNGEAMSEDAFIHILSQITKKENPKETCKILKIQQYIQPFLKLTKEFGNKEVFYTIGQRSFLTFTTEDIQCYLYEICFPYSNPDELIKLRKSVSIGAELFGFSTTDTISS